MKSRITKENKKGDKVMKTNFKSHRGNNVQKTVTKTLAVVVSLVLISITVNAQEFWTSVLKNSSFNTIAAAMVDRYPKAENNNANVSATAGLTAYEMEIEKPLELESWMTKDNAFNSISNFETETESPLQLEDWMINENSFTLNHVLMEVETEEPLKLENWMLKDYFDNVVEKEQPLQLESWMIAFENRIR